MLGTSNNTQMKVLLLSSIFVIGFLTFQNVYADEMTQIFVSNPPNSVYIGDRISFVINTIFNGQGLAMPTYVYDNGVLDSPSFTLPNGQGYYSYAPKSVGLHHIIFEINGGNGHIASISRDVNVLPSYTQNAIQEGQQQSLTISVNTIPSSSPTESSGSNMMVLSTTISVNQTAQYSITIAGGSSPYHLEVYTMDNTHYVILGTTDYDSSSDTSYTYTVSKKTDFDGWLRFLVTDNTGKSAFQDVKLSVQSPFPWEGTLIIIGVLGFIFGSMIYLNLRKSRNSNARSDYSNDAISLDKDSERAETESRRKQESEYDKHMRRMFPDWNKKD